MIIRTMTSASMSQIELLLSHFPLLVMGYPLFISDRQNGPTYFINHTYQCYHSILRNPPSEVSSFVGYYSIFAQPVATPLVGVNFARNPCVDEHGTPTRGVATKLDMPAQVR